MRIINKLLIIILLVGLLSCFNKLRKEPILVLPSGEKILYGKIDRDQLFVYFPEWQEVYNSYNPDPAILQQLAKYNLDIAVEIFFGTWCADSRREVPRFYRILDTARFISDEQVDLWAVDRQKRLNNNFTQDKNIQFVATFIFSRDGKEIDRIVEAPYETLEKDILKILNDI